MLHPRFTIGAMLVSLAASIVTIGNAVTTLSGPLQVLDAQHASRIIAGAAIASGLAAVIAGLGKSPLNGGQR